MRAMGVALVMAAGALSGCVANADNAEAQANAVHVEFQVEDSAGHAATAFHNDDTVHFVFRVQNNDVTPQALAFTFPPHRVRVVSSAGAPVWQAFEGRMFPQVMRTQDVPAGESIAFTAEWEARDLAPGVYRVQPEFIGFLSSGAPLASNLPAVSIHIE